MSSKVSKTTKETFILKKAWKDRTFRTAALAFLLVIVMGLLRPDESAGMYPKEYWATKIGWRHCADMILAGDSRTLVSLSPAIIQEKFPDRRIYNYGFAGMMYSVEYLEAVEDVLDPQSKDKTIVMGITPNTLLEKTVAIGNFSELKELSKQDLLIDIYFAPFIHFFEPMSFHDAAQGMFPSLAESQTVKKYTADGWVGVHKIPTVRSELKNYLKLFDLYTVSGKRIDNVVNYVAKWTNSGVKVYGFIAPSCKEMVELEKEHSGFDKTEFIKLFKAAGGKWIDTDPGQYDSFDGSHLLDNAAVEFSKDFTERLYEIEKKN